MSNSRKNALVGSGSVVWIYRSADLDLKRNINGSASLLCTYGLVHIRVGAFHFDVDPDLAAQNDADPDPQHCQWHCTDL
jgi:hypothetical protein